MKRLAFVSLLLAVPVHAGDRTVVVTDFDRIRIDGPYEVHLALHGTPSARVAGPAAEAGGVELRVEGTTLIVRRGLAPAGPAWGPTLPNRAGAGKSAANVPAAIVWLRTTALRSAGVIGTGTLDITGPLRSPRVDLQITGSGSIAAHEIDSAQVNATLIGSGAMALGGRAAQVRLIGSGSGATDATALQADSLVLRLDGTGTTHASARYFADVATTGKGAATVYGKPKCRVKAAVGGPIDCGVPLPETVADGAR